MHGRGFRVLVGWLAVLVLAVANGAFREAVLAPRVSPVAAQVASGLVLCALIFAAACAEIRWMRLASATQAWRAGVAWLVLTVVFELVFGLVQGQSAKSMLAAYTFQGGSLWPLVLLTTFVSPFAAFRIRGSTG